MNYASSMGTVSCDGSWVGAPFSRFDGVWLHGDWLDDFSIAGDFAPTNSIGFGEPYGKVHVTGNLFLSNVCFGVGPGVEFSCHDLTLTSNASMTLQSALVTVTNVTTPEYGALVNTAGELSSTAVAGYIRCFPRPYRDKQQQRRGLIVQGQRMTVAENASSSNKFGYPGGNWC